MARARAALREILARSGQPANRVIPVLPAPQDRPDLREPKVLLGRLALRRPQPPTALSALRSNCEAAACRAECNQNEVLVIAYCGPRRSPVTLINERTVTCARGAPNSPLVMVCAKVSP